MVFTTEERQLFFVAKYERKIDRNIFLHQRGQVSVGVQKITQLLGNTLPDYRHHPVFFW